MLASTVGGSLAQGKTGEKYYGRKIVGGFLAVFFTSLLAEVAPMAAAGLATGMSGYAFFNYGLPAIDSHYKQQQKKPATTHTPQPKGQLV